MRRYEKFILVYNFWQCTFRWGFVTGCIFFRQLRATPVSCSWQSLTGIQFKDLKSCVVRYVDILHCECDGRRRRYWQSIVPILYMDDIILYYIIFQSYAVGGFSLCKCRMAGFDFVHQYYYTSIHYCHDELWNH